MNPVTGVKTWYYVEYRQAIGFDRCITSNDTTIGCYPYLDSANILNGVIVHTGVDGSTYSGSHLLDMTPNYSTTSFDWANPALPFGSSFYDPASGVTITAVSGNGTTATISVNQGAPGCQRFAPTLTLSPNSSSLLVQKILPGGSFDYNLTVKNNDSSACSAATFSLGQQGYVPPIGWSLDYGTASVVLAPGSSAATLVRISAPSTAPLSSWQQITVAANHSASSALFSYLYAYLQVVNTPTLSMAVSTDKATYAKGATVAMTSNVSLGSAVVSGASVTFTITKPNGSVVTKSGVTLSSGQVTVSLRLSKGKDPVGTYQIKATTTSGGQSASALTSFTVN